MGLSISSQLNTFLIQYLKSLQRSGQNFYTVQKYEREFLLNGSSGSPKCIVCISNSSISAPEELFFEESDVYTERPLAITAPIININIGEAVFSCDELGTHCRVSGNIKIIDVRLTAVITPIFDDGIKIDDYESKVTVKRIKSEIQLTVNRSDQSRLANALLSTDNPDLANTILNGLLTLQKRTIIELINEHLETAAF